MIFKIIPELIISSESLKVYQIQIGNCMQNISISECSARNPSCLSFVSGRRRPTLLSTKTIPTIFPQRISDEYFSGNRSHIHTHLSCFWCKRSKRSKRRLENCALFGRRVSSDVLVVVVQDRVQCQLVKVGHKLH